VLEGAGSHFSFGASVEEHVPEKVGEMLRTFHAMFRDLEALSVPTAAVVRGQCLGGGMELALWCGRVFCEPGARFGLPEVKLGVLPPVGAILLPRRTGSGRAMDLLLGGESVTGEEAAATGLAEECDADPEAALQRWFDARLAPKSAVALRHVWRAGRRSFARALAEDLPDVERTYLEELMAHRDPAEGIRSFLERREPVWEDR
jgi:cyclohexa-1,5-dienecarbonyl-CoA hydratase